MVISKVLHILTCSAKQTSQKGVNSVDLYKLTVDLRGLIIAYEWAKGREIRYFQFTPTAQW